MKKRLREGAPIRRSPFKKYPGYVRISTTVRSLVVPATRRLAIHPWIASVVCRTVRLDWKGRPTLWGFSDKRWSVSPSGRIFHGESVMKLLCLREACRWIPKIYCQYACTQNLLSSDFPEIAANHIPGINPVHGARASASADRAQV